MPDVVGLRANRATDVARRFGLNIAFTIERTDETDPGIVIRQRPGAGEPASLGDTMSVVVAGRPG